MQTSSERSLRWGEFHPWWPIPRSDKREGPLGVGHHALHLLVAVLPVGEHVRDRSLLAMHLFPGPDVVGMLAVERDRVLEAALGVAQRSVAHRVAALPLRIHNRPFPAERVDLLPRPVIIGIPWTSASRSGAR